MDDAEITQLKMAGIGIKKIPWLYVPMNNASFMKKLEGRHNIGKEGTDLRLAHGAVFLQIGLAGNPLDKLHGKNVIRRVFVKIMVLNQVGVLDVSG